MAQFEAGNQRFDNKERSGPMGNRRDEATLAYKELSRGEQMLLSSDALEVWKTACSLEPKLGMLEAIPAALSEHHIDAEPENRRNAYHRFLTSAFMKKASLEKMEGAA